MKRAGLPYTREMLAVSLDRLASHLFLVVGHEIHGESFVIAMSCVWNVRMRVFGCVITFNLKKSLMLDKPDPLPRLAQRGRYAKLLRDC